MTSGAASSRTLNLKAGDPVEVRSWDEISTTLDERGRLENLPFMAEMLQYCGQRFRVFKRADKTCNYIAGWSIRRMKDAVHLEGVRCDGAGHGGCEAGCLIFWKEAWLKRVDGQLVPVDSLGLVGRRPPAGPAEAIVKASHSMSPQGDTIYSCQGTEVPKFTSYMSSWDMRQYVRDLTSGNLSSGLASASRAHRWLDTVLGVIQVLRSLTITAFNRVQTARHGSMYPFIAGTQGRSPSHPLDLKPGELVQVKSKDEILATLDKNQRNRGLWFDSEMLPYCAGIYRVLRRVHHIIEEPSGKMITMKHACIVLDGVVCRSDFHRLCPRAIYPYWREEWLMRAESPPGAQQKQDVAASQF